MFKTNEHITVGRFEDCKYCDAPASDNSDSINRGSCQHGPRVLKEERFHVVTASKIGNTNMFVAVLEKMEE